jgi:hypothetical protein
MLATQEAEIRRIAVGNQPGQIGLETLSRKIPNTNKWLMEWLKWKRACLASMRP